MSIARLLLAFVVPMLMALINLSLYAAEHATVNLAAGIACAAIGIGGLIFALVTKEGS